MSLTESLGTFILTRTSRRGFLARATVGATALAVAPVDVLTKPGTAYAAICSCGGYNCDCSAACCDGYTQFCCTINNGYNICPPGTFAGGWWKADGSAYCAGPRYYIDCQGTCHGCGCAGGSFCSSCDGLVCECALGDCNNRHVGCALFRYGQCHMEIGCSGRIACRVVSCTPPWILDPTCSTVAQVDENTANHYAPCQNGPTSYPPPPPPPPRPVAVGMAATATGHGYWLADNYGGVHAYGDAVSFGSMSSTKLAQPVVGIAGSATGHGYWLAAADGGVFCFGDALFHGSAGGTPLAQPVVGVAADIDSGGYRLVAADGGIFDFQAPFFGSAGSIQLTKPVVGMTPAPDNQGYWLVASDGGVFAYGDAVFYGSMGGKPLDKPVVGMAATRTGRGYWLAASDGGVFCFGDALFYGSAFPASGTDPVVGMAATATGFGYWLITRSGVVHPFGDAVSYGQGV